MAVYYNNVQGRFEAHDFRDSREPWAAKRAGFKFDIAYALWTTHDFRAVRSVCNMSRGRVSVALHASAQDARAQAFTLLHELGHAAEVLALNDGVRNSKLSDWRSSRMNSLAPEKFARDWIAAWNRSDAEAVLTHYADQTVFVSPLAANLTGDPEIRGKAELRTYWTKALRSRPSPPQFRLDSFTWDKNNRAILIVYVSIESERRVRKCELMHFGPVGLICRGEAFVGSTVDSVSTTSISLESPRPHD